MLTRREVVSAGWYAIVFASVVTWAALRPTVGPSPSDASFLAAGANGSLEPLEHSQREPEMRRVVQRMMLH